MLRLILMVLCIGMGSPAEGAGGRNAVLIGGGAGTIASVLLLGSGPLGWIVGGFGLAGLTAGLYGKYQKTKKS